MISILRRARAVKARAPEPDMTTVLLVDDERCLLEALALVLEEEGFEVMMAFNGREAVDRLSASPPDVVVSDVMMPIMDGRQLLRQLRSEPSTRDIPVILMTAAPLPELENGVPVIRKPFDIDALLTEIRRAMAVRPKLPD
jgi:CheY-like chemotaxis protein